MYEGKQNARLSTVIDCGTIRGARKIYLGFQLADFKAIPKDKELPGYCVYTKFPYGGLITNYKDSGNSSILEALGYKGGVVLDFLLDNVGKNVVLNILDNEYNEKIFPILANGGHEVFEGVLDVERGTELKTFKLTDSATKADIDALGFDNKHVKKSDEYRKIKSSDATEEEVDNLF